jgi:hypothetical protein
MTLLVKCGRVKVAEELDLTRQLEQSRFEILQLAERVKNLIEKRSQRQAMVQQFRRSTETTSLSETRFCRNEFNLCTLCATARASSSIKHVRASAQGVKCDDCGQPADMWIQFDS